MLLIRVEVDSIVGRLLKKCKIKLLPCKGLLYVKTYQKPFNLKDYN